MFKMGNVRDNKVAVVGSGISGLSSAWMLQRCVVRVILLVTVAHCAQMYSSRMI
jgi:glycine/D-amino acid oxidase-like deaminating enzyme